MSVLLPIIYSFGNEGGKTMKEKHLLFRLTKKDFIVEPFKGSGAGGQHRNKTMSCSRIRHPNSGAVAEASEQRYFHQNKKTAFERLLKKSEFQKWHRIMCAKALGSYIDPEEWVEKQMNRLKFEVKIDGKWTEIKPEDIKYEDLED